MNTLTFASVYMYLLVPESFNFRLLFSLNLKGVENGPKKQSWWKGQGREEEEGREG